MEKITCKNFRSCFIVDVQLRQNTIMLSDSAHNKYFVDPNDQNLRKEFTDWFKHVFQKGIAQTLTVIAYEIIDVSECEQELHVVKFLKQDE